MARSDYVNGKKKKWVSDQDFLQTFDNFLPQHQVQKEEKNFLAELNKKKLT